MVKINLCMTQTILYIRNKSIRPYEEIIWEKAKPKSSCANTLAHLNDDINWGMVW